MTLVPPETILTVFLLFCRIGGCLMLMPGFSSSRVPVQVRLFIAVAVTLALSPILLPTVNVVLPNIEPAAVLSLILSETLTGALIGLIGRRRSKREPAGDEGVSSAARNVSSSRRASKSGSRRASTRFSGLSAIARCR